ncbi:MAG: hypothetical protein ACF8Q5_04800 [Phycisphaerales bacterium JB040]
MATPRPTGGLTKALVWAGVVFLVLSLACVFFGVLGLLGVVADVGPHENRVYGWRLLRYALIPLTLAGIAFAIALATRRSR